VALTAVDGPILQTELGYNGVAPLRCIVVLLCGGCVLLVTFIRMELPSVRIDTTRLTNGSKPNIESRAFAGAHPTSKSEEQTLQQEPQKSEAPKTILVWTKLYNGTDWDCPRNVEFSLVLSSILQCTVKFFSGHTHLISIVCNHSLLQYTSKNTHYTITI